VIGDPLAVAAGVLREPLPVLLVLVTIEKVARYLAVAAVRPALRGAGSAPAGAYGPDRDGAVAAASASTSSRRVGQSGHP
jgi:hypothetical protein